MGNFFCFFGCAPPPPPPPVVQVGALGGLQAGCLDPPDLQNYNICLDLEVEDDRVASFLNARDRWLSILAGHIGTRAFVGSRDTPLSDQGEIFFSSDAPRVVDDMYMFAKEEFIDGPFKVLGSAGPKRVFTSSDGSDIANLPYAGTMRFDIDDVTRLLNEGRLEDTITHEMGHILGIGTRWRARGIANSGRTEYFGTAVKNEWNNFYNCQGDILIEQDGGAGTQGSHWDDKCFNNEMMTGFLNRERNFISRISVAGLDDLGYTVNYDQAENGATFNSFCCNTGSPPQRRALDGNIDEQTLDNGPEAARNLGLIEDLYGITDLVTNTFKELSQELIEAGAEYAFKELSRIREQLGNEDDPSGLVGNVLIVFMFDDDGNIVDREYTWEEASSYQQLNLRGRR